MKLYENIVIGNFLFSLGYAIRNKQSSGILGCAINLLQQTPADKLLGDLLMEFVGVVRLIEFKADSNKSPKEKSRHTKLKTAIGLSHHEQVSRSVHWYIETSAKTPALVARIIPYLDAFPESPVGQNLECFIDALAEEVSSPHPQFSREDILSYLDLVRRTQGDGTVGTGGLLLLVESNGTLHYLPMSDLMELRLQHRECIQHHVQRMERESQHQMQMEKEQRYRSISHGMGRGM